MPSGSGLNTNTRKFIVSYISPIRIRSVLDTTHVVLEDLTGRLISGIHHTNRIKAAYVKTKDGVVSDCEGLNKVINNSDVQKDISDAFVSYDYASEIDKTFSFESEHSFGVCEGDELEYTKNKFRNGDCEVLFTTKDKSWAEWYNLSLFPVLKEELDNSLDRVSGSVEKLNRSIFHS